MKVHLVDGTFELYRAHFGKGPRRTWDGRDASASAGVGRALLALVADETERATHLAVAFDNPIRSFRNELFDGYKTDDGVPEELRGQFDLVERVTRALGFVTWSMDRWEADDALATAATSLAARPDVDEVVIASPDKDLGQCVQGARVVQLDRIRRRRLAEPEVREARGVPPASVPDLLALMGDPQDGVPGLPGFGAKTAAKLVARWGTVEAIPDDEAAWDVKVAGAPRLGAVLREGRAALSLYKRLTTLVRDVPIDCSPETLAWRGPRDEDADWLAAFDGSLAARARELSPAAVRS